MTEKDQVLAPVLGMEVGIKGREDLKVRQGNGCAHSLGS